MKVLITSTIFPPERHPSGIIIKEFAEYLTIKGWEVTIVTGFPNHPFGKLFAGYKRQLIQTEKQDGFQVIRTWHIINSSPLLGKRALVMVSQVLGYLFGALSRPRVDLVITFGPPIIGYLASGMVALLFKAKLVSVVYDLYPDVLINMGALKKPILISLFTKGEALTYSLSNRIAVLGEGFQQVLISQKKVDPKKVSIIPVWLDGREISPQNRDNRWRRDKGISCKKFVVLYAGTIGLVSGADVVLRAAELIQWNPDILFLMVGTGQVKNKLEIKARKTGMKNILFFPFQDRKVLSEMQATADISLVTLAPGMGKTSVPSKVLGYMAAARAIIASVDEDCDTAKLIRKSNCGLVVPPGKAAALAKAVAYFYDRPHERHLSAIAGRQYFMENFEKGKVMEKFYELLVDATKLRLYH